MNFSSLKKMGSKKPLLPVFLVGLFGLTFLVILGMNYVFAAPTPPGGTTVTTTVLTGTSIRVTLEPGSGDSGTNWSFATSSDNVTRNVVNVTTPTTTLTYDFTGLSTNTLYYLAVASGDGAATSSYNTSTAVYTLADTPGTPALSAATIQGFTVRINSSTNPAATTYIIRDTASSTQTYYLQSNGTWGTATATFTYDQLGPVNGTTTINTAVSMSTNTIHRISVAAVNGAGVTTSYGTSADIITLADPAGAPTIGTPTVTTLPITLVTNSNPATTTYAIYNTSTGNFLDAAGASSASAVWQTSTGWASVSATGLATNTVYQFVVIARNGNGVTAATSSASTATYTLAPAPSADSVAGAENGLTFSWSGNATQYYAEDETAGTNTGWITGTSYALGAINCGTIHTFRVKGRNGDNTETAWSSSISGTTNACGTPIVSGGGGGGSSPAPTTPPPTTPTALESALAAGCPTLASGDMVKVTGKPAIYSVNKDLKVLYFPSGDEFKSWNVDEKYGGYKSVTQKCFDALSVPTAYPGAVNYRPGSYVVKRASSDQLYVILPGNSLAKISSADATALYGSTYKVKTVADPFWPHYLNRSADVSEKAHQGMLVKKDGKTWYVDAGNVLREVTSAGMTANRFKSIFVRTVSESYLTGFTTGALIDAVVSSLADRTQ